MDTFETSALVLVVEDDPLVRMNATDLLEDAGVKTVEAENSAEAITIMKSRADVSVLFTDVQMPGSIDGIELARRVHFQWPNVLLLITSGNMSPKQYEIPDHGHFLRNPTLLRR